MLNYYINASDKDQLLIKNYLRGVGIQFHDPVLFFLSPLLPGDVFDFRLNFNYYGRVASCFAPVDMVDKLIDHFNGQLAAFGDRALLFMPETNDLADKNFTIETEDFRIWRLLVQPIQKMTTNDLVSVLGEVKNVLSDGVDDFIAGLDDAFKVLPLISTAGVSADVVRFLDHALVTKLLRFRVDVVTRISSLHTVDSYRSELLNSSVDYYPSPIYYPGNVNLYAFNRFSVSLKDIESLVNFSG